MERDTAISAREHARPPVLEPGHTYGSLTDKISSITLRKRTSLGWFVAFATTFLLVALLIASIVRLIAVGAVFRKVPSSALPHTIVVIGGAGRPLPYRLHVCQPADHRRS